MKEMNETQLRSWRPRQPSAGLKRRLLKFPGEDDIRSARWLLSCVAPTMACALLTFMAYNRDAGPLEVKEPMAMILSNQNNVAYATGAAGNEENHLATVTFDSTNRNNLGSSIRFTSPTTQTN